MQKKSDTVQENLWRIMGHLLAEGVILGSVQWVEREEEECDSFFMSVGTSRDVDNIRNSQVPILIPYLILMP